MPRHLFTFRLIPIVGAYLAQRGIDPRPLVLEARLPLQALSGEITSPLTRIRAFIDSVAELTGDDLFGLHLSTMVPLGVYGVAEFLPRSAPDLEVGLRVLADYASLINPIGRFLLLRTPEGVAMHYTISGERDVLGKQLTEYSLSYILRQTEAAVDGPLPIHEVWFAHTRDRHTEALAERFGCAVRFGEVDCGFTLTREVASRRPRTADAPLFEFLLDQARAQLARLGPPDIVTRLIRVLEVRVGTGDLAIEAVASAMASSPRSIQRHLADAGTTYRDVLHHVRTRRRSELLHAGATEDRIARQLGFADVRSMRRALDEA